MITNFFCFIPLSLGAKLEFLMKLYIEIGLSQGRGLQHGHQKNSLRVRRAILVTKRILF